MSAIEPISPKSELTGHDNVADALRSSYLWLMTTLEYLWTAIFITVWFWLSFEMVKTARSGRFWFVKKSAAGKSWPPLRAEAPAKFWLVWSALAWPFLMLPLVIAVGWLLMP